LKVDAGYDPFIPKMRLFHNRKKCVRWCESHLNETPELIDGAEAQVCWMGNVAVVLMEASDADEVVEYAVLCHEAYHIVSMNLTSIGEEDAGEEIIAYMVQITSMALMEAHREWKEKHECQ